jgi:hypothetical protein
MTGTQCQDDERSNSEQLSATVIWTFKVGGERSSGTQGVISSLDTGRHYTYGYRVAKKTQLRGETQEFCRCSGAQIN